jgi:hypothetical protein
MEGGVILTCGDSDGDSGGEERGDSCREAVNGAHVSSGKRLGAVLGGDRVAAPEGGRVGRELPDKLKQAQL